MSRVPPDTSLPVVSISRRVRWYAVGIPFGIVASLCFETLLWSTGYASSHTPLGWALVNAGYAAAITLAVVAPLGLFTLWCWSRMSLTYAGLERDPLVRLVGLIVLAIGLTGLVATIIACIQVGSGPWSLVQLRDSFKAGFDASVLMLVTFAAAFVAPRFIIPSLKGPGS